MIHNLNVEINNSNAIANIGTGYYKNIFPASSYHNRKIFFYTPIPTSQGPQWWESKFNPDTGEYEQFVKIDPPISEKTGDPVPIPNSRPASGPNNK